MKTAAAQDRKESPESKARIPAVLPPVVYEDEALLVFDKPSGLLVAPDRWDKDRDNLMRLVHQRLSPQYFNVHRLDADTSGLLVCAKTKPALDALALQFERGTARKTYLALTCGVPAEPTGRIELLLTPDEAWPGRMRVARNGGGKAATTCYEVAESFRGYALLKVQPLTGRTHQIRVHLAAVGCPVLADRFYGQGRGLLLSALKRRYKQKKNEPERPLLGRLALHAARLELAHPVTGAPLVVEAPLPHDFEVALKYLRRYAG